MTDRYPPINPKCPHFLHGGDYNPDQWPSEVWQEDMRLMTLAHCNAMSVGIFSWARLEPSEGQYDFEWLDRVMDLLAENEAYAILATPSGAKPAWMAEKYPEVLRVRPDRTRNLWGGRHNHCPTSPVYREKVHEINLRLAERYKEHPALLIWHISNEFGGDCHCDLCRDAFRDWLKARYDNDLDRLNEKWWCAFWSHLYSDWSQIIPPSPLGDERVHGLNLNWKRFVTDQMADFYRHEIRPLREITPGVPVTTNLMGTYPGLNYWKFAPDMDVISWDSYPSWHREAVGIEDRQMAVNVSFTHDLNRSLKRGQPFMLMESTPSMTNWQAVAKLKRPGMHQLASLQAVAHGSDTIQYFQWRKSRGSSEKFHGAVVDHVGHENTRVFRDVARIGETLEKMDCVIGAKTLAPVALLYDWENRWAIEDAKGPRVEKKDYQTTCERHYAPFWERGIAVDVLDMDEDFAGYRVLVAPMLYMVRPGVAERIEEFVKNGGVFVATYWSGIVDEDDSCFLNGFPGPLRGVLGIWSEEIDALYDGEENGIAMEKGNDLGLKGPYSAQILCDLIHAETAEVLATYQDDFYAGRPALTAHSAGKGKAYYVAFRSEDAFLDDFYGRIADDLALPRALDIDLPEGVTVQARTDGESRYVFLLNFSAKEQTVDLGKIEAHDMESGKNASGKIRLEKNGSRILKVNE